MAGGAWGSFEHIFKEDGMAFSVRSWCGGASCVLVCGLLLVAQSDLCSAGPMHQAASGTFDINNIDCNNLDKLDRRFRNIAERKCKEGQPNYTITNKSSVASEPTPADVYSGGDKKKLEKMIREAWKAKYPKDDILGVRFHMKDWKRDANYKANSTSIYKTDTSVLAVSVVVKDNADTATIFPAYINKDNLSGGIDAGVSTKTSEYVVKQMLVKNWKP